jgi:hypothetical protein
MAGNFRPQLQPISMRFLRPFWMWLAVAIMLRFPTSTAAQGISRQAFGMHIRCTPGGGQNPDCPTPTAWPSIPTAPNQAQPIGSLRMHDDGAKFGNIQAHRTPDCNESVTSGCAWGAFDEWIRQARKRRVELLYVFSRTPEWACAKHSGCAPSDLPEDGPFLNFVKAVRDRKVDGRSAGCRSGDGSDSGCIRYWEVWNEPNNGKSAFCGSIGDVVHLARLISETVKATDSSAQVVSPGVGYTANYNGSSCSAGGISGAGACSRWGKGNGNPEAYICEYLRQSGSHSGDRTGREYTDVVGWHAYPTHSMRRTIAEDNILKRVQNIRSAMQDTGLKPCAPGQNSGCAQLWITETSWGSVGAGGRNDSEMVAANCALVQSCPRIGPLNDAGPASYPSSKPGAQPGFWSHDQAAYLAKLHVLALSSGVSRVFWYWWDGQPWGTLFCKVPNAAAGCSEQARTQPYLQNAARAYGEVEWWLQGGSQIGCSQSADGTIACDLTDASGGPAQIVWNSMAPRAFSPAKQFVVARDIYGNSESVSRSFTVGYSPVLLKPR